MSKNIDVEINNSSLVLNVLPPPEISKLTEHNNVVLPGSSEDRGTSVRSDTMQNKVHL